MTNLFFLRLCKEQKRNFRTLITKLSSTDFIPEAYTFSKNGMLFFPAQHATG
jgi:hypothetical protein